MAARQRSNRGVAPLMTSGVSHVSRDRPVYRVGDLDVDIGRVIVSRAGQQLPLPKLSFDLLLALIERAPDVASLDELLDRVWAGVIVSPETVSQRVKLLRDALGDDPKEPRYIAGVRGRGYRLIPPVQRGIHELRAHPATLATGRCGIGRPDWRDISRQSLGVAARKGQRRGLQVDHPVSRGSASP
jgi:DNA-binding winged helix-turn-helix (wHTH) protein